jgi:hypothetical protein
MVGRTYTRTSLALFALAACNSPRATSPAPSTAGGEITITRRDVQQTSRGPAENFTGKVEVQRLFLPESPSRMQGAYVALAEQLEGQAAAWMEKVTPAQYSDTP